MAIKRRDLGFIVIVVLLLAILLVTSLRDKPKRLPVDEGHRPFAEALARGEGRESVEKGCPVCHGGHERPLPPKHPPKEQCLICHQAVLAH
jgi:cytochrome c5